MSEEKNIVGVSPVPRVKRVLAVTFSQTGQLRSVVEKILEPLREQRAGVEVHVETLRPQKAFPFPWSLRAFFDAFPESAHLAPAPLQPLTLGGDEEFDLVILAYQVWFLAPSQPVVAFLKSEQAARLLAGKPVITVIACRNMWLLAHEKMKSLLKDVGARLIDNVVLTDRAPTLATLITTPRWLLTGKRDSFLGLPPAGIAFGDIERCRRFGRALRDALAQHRERGTQPLLTGLRAVEAAPELLVSEHAGTRSFFVWGKLIRLLGPAGAWQRAPLLVVYLIFLLAMIITVVPISLTLQALFRPFLKEYLAMRKEYFEQPSGSGSERLSQYDC